MARLTPIRITENDRKEYSKLAKSAKAKIKRTHKTYGIDLREEIPVPKLEDFATRSEFNEWKEKASSFTNRNNLNFQFKKNKFGVVASKKELNQIERDTKRAQRLADQINDAAKDKPFYSGGKEQATVGQRAWMLGKESPTEVVRPPNFNFNNIQSRKQLESKSRNMRDRSDPKHFDKRKAQMKENFEQLLAETFNSDANGLIFKLKDISPDTFYEMFLNNEEFQFTYYYTNNLEGEGHEGHIDAMLSVIERVERNERAEHPLKGLFEN